MREKRKTKTTEANIFTIIAGLHDHFNSGQLSVEAFFYLNKITDDG